jgi:hypothetical protein
MCRVITEAELPQVRATRVIVASAHFGGKIVLVASPRWHGSTRSGC